VSRRRRDRALVELGSVDEMMDGVKAVLEGEEGEKQDHREDEDAARPAPAQGGESEPAEEHGPRYARPPRGGHAQEWSRGLIPDHPGGVCH